MAIVFIDGFDHYSSSQFAKKWTTVNGSPSVSAGRFGGQCLTLNSTHNIEKVFTSTSQAWRIGFAFRINSANSSFSMINIKDGASAQCELTVLNTRKLEITRNGTLVGSAGTTTLSLSTWYWVEMYVSIKDSLSSGNCQVYLNGVQEVNVTSGDIQNTANAYADRVNISGASFWNFDIDDLVISQEADSTTPTFLGERRILTVYPNGSGNYSNFLGSDGNSVNNYQLVDDATVIDEADYVTSDTVGNRDSYTMGDLSLTPSTIDAVQITANMRKDDSGARVGRVFFRIGGSNYESSDIALLSSYLVYTHMALVDPSTSSAWGASNVNSMEVGVKVQS